MGMLAPFPVPNSSIGGFDRRAMWWLYPLLEETTPATPAASSVAPSRIKSIDREVMSAMTTATLTEFGRGADTSNNPTLLPPGVCRQSINMLHNRGFNRAALRKGITRLNHTRLPASDQVTYGLYEYTSAAGVRTKLALTPINGTQAQLTSVSTTKTSIRTSITLATKVGFATAFNFWLFASGSANAAGTAANWIGNATVAYPYGDSPSDAIVPTAGAAGALTGTFYYTYSRLSSTTGELSDPSSAGAVSVALVAQRAALGFGALTTNEQFDQVRIYRTKVGTTGPFYKVTDIAISSLPTTDNATDASLTVLSTQHTLAGATKTSRMEAANDVVFYRGRIHWVGLKGNLSRQRWTQLLSFVSDSTTDARHDIDADDGDTAVRGFSIDGCLALFKEHSIHIMDGDIDEKSFTWQVASDRSVGIGAYAPWTAVSTPVGIIFMGENGIYAWRPRTGGPKLISGPDRQDPLAPSIQTTLEAANQAQRLNFDAFFDPVERLYVINFAGASATTNNQSWAYSIESGTWSQWKWGMGNTRPTASALMHNSSSRLKAYFADQYGYVYETNTDLGSDGPISGTQTGTATGGSDTTVVDSGASFYATGDDLEKLSVTVEKTGPLFETQLISSNTGTTLTTPSWTSDPAAADLYFVGALEGVLSFGRMDMGKAYDKAFQAINIEFQKQTVDIHIIVGFTIDGDTEPTTIYSLVQTGGFRLSIPVERTGVGLSPYIRIIGTNAAFELIKLEVEYLQLMSG